MGGRAGGEGGNRGSESEAGGKVVRGDWGGGRRAVDVGEGMEGGRGVWKVGGEWVWRPGSGGVEGVGGRDRQWYLEGVDGADKQLVDGGSQPLVPRAVLVDILPRRRHVEVTCGNKPNKVHIAIIRTGFAMIPILECRRY